MLIIIAIVALLLFILVGTQEYDDERGAMNAIKVLYVLTTIAFVIMVVAFGISTFYDEPYDRWDDEQENYHRNVEDSI